MAEFEDVNSLEAWLKDEPPEFACILAVRAALRVVPLLNQALRQDAEARRGSVVLSCFRALSTAYFMSAWPARAGEVRSNGRQARRWANNLFADAFNSAQREIVELAEIGKQIFPETYDHGLYKSEDIVEAATLSVLAAVETVDAKNGVASFDAVPETASKAISKSFGAIYGIHDETHDAVENSIEKEDSADITKFWALMEKDAEFLLENDWQDSHRAVTALSEMELWLGSPPVWAGKRWADLKDEFPENEGWNVWIEWYEARLVGKPANEALEFERVTIQNEEWQNGAPHINEIIRRKTRPKETESLEYHLSSLDEIRQKIADGVTPEFGHPQETKCRAEMRSRIEVIRTFSSEPASEHGKIGHNRPPEHLQIEEGMRREVVETVEDLDREVEKSNPNVDTVVEAVTKIGKILKRIGTKFTENMVTHISWTKARDMYPSIQEFSEKVSHLIVAAVDWLKTTLNF